jgi:ATP-binding cassette, subfamily B, bacterial
MSPTAAAEAVAPAERDAAQVAAVDAGPERPPPVLRRILAEARPFRSRIVAVAVLDLLATPLLLLTPIPLKVAVDSVLGDKPLPGYLDAVIPDALQRTDHRLLAAAAVLQILVVLLAESQQVAAYVLRTITGEQITLRFRARLLRHAQRLSMVFHDTRGTADSIYRIQWDAPALQWITNYGLISMVSAAVMLVAMAVVTAAIDSQLALISLTVAPGLFLLAHRYNARMRARYLEVKGIESNALEVVQEVLTSFRVVTAFGREASEEARFVGRGEAHVRAQTRLSFMEGLFGLLVNLTTAVGTAAVLFVGVRGVQSGRLTLGELLMVVTYLAQLYAPLKVISKEVADLQSGLASAQRAFDLLDETPDVADRPDARALERASGDLEFRNVTFGYGSNPSVLRKANLRIPAGSILGVVGRTGAGKTTLVSLLPRFFDPDDGVITLDGVDLRDLKLVDLRNQFAIVLQDSVLFSTTIAENIAYARPDATEAEVVAAARAAGAHDFITHLPDGYATTVGERGMRLSGGERQRIGLARAFLKDAPILILDEPTSSVDVRTEEAIMDAMRRLMVGRTTIMIAHRLTTLAVCDAVVEVADGRITPFDPSAGPPAPRRRRRAPLRARWS